MAKSKDEKDEEKSDGLEIISIGSLYSGVWDKKYWSSSRGKDRYPYPVGYQARRAYNGSTYRMEIQEGHKGPLFVITSADGHLCSGQTADMAWKKFQKKGCLRMKIWHGKRFSCNIDGIEFFGFRNPFVQRLLRELVANVNGIAESSLLSSSTCEGASNIQHNNQHQGSQTSSDLLPNLAMPQITGKRIKRRDVINPKSLSINSKRLRAGDSTCIVEPSNLIHGNLQQGSKLPGGLPMGEQLEYVTGEENSHFSAKDGLSLKSVEYSDHLRGKAVPAHEESKLARSEDNKSTIVSNSYAEEKPLDRVRDSEVDGLNLPALSELTAADALCVQESQTVHDVDLCAPDTLDTQDDTTNSAPSTSNKITCGVKGDLMATDVVVSEELMDKSFPGEETGISNSSVSSEKSDFDSACQDIAKSMMTVLLPQAIPLLKKSLSKKKRTVSPSGNFPFIPSPHKEKNETSLFVEAQSHGIDHSVVQSSEHTQSIVLDTFDDGQCGDLVLHLLPSNSVETDQPTSDKDASPSNSEEQFVNVDVKDSWVFHLKTSESKDVLHDDKMQLNLTKRPQDGDLYLSKSILGCISTGEKVFSEVNQHRSEHLVEKSGAEINSKDFKTAADCNEAEGTSDTNIGALGSSVQLSRMDAVVKAGTSQISNISSSQVPKKVYTRKKFPNTKPIARKHNPPLLESIICRKVLDGHLPETTGALLDLERFCKSSSVDELQKKELLCVDTMVGEELHGLHTDKTTITSHPLSDSRLPLILQTQDFVASEGQNTSNLFVLSESTAEKLQAHFKERLVGHANTLDVNPGLEKQGTAGFYHNKTSISKEAQANSELKIMRNLELNNELEGIVELLGCYFHPMPVLSLLLSRKENEIYICALCGLLVDKDRTLFLYKLAIEEPSKGRPCFVGHTSVTWLSSIDILGREIAFERSGLQLTPDGQCLVLLGNTRTPYCRERRIDCLCSTCASNYFENNTVKIVQVKAGYVSLAQKLTTTDILQCILVCEPNHLIAAGESRRLYLWTMNSRWSAPTEAFTILSNDYISPCIMELKRIPKCASLVIAHNGSGEFTLWDISRRIFISRFSALSISVYQLLPISLFSWQREVHDFGYSNVQAQINGLMDATKMQFSDHSKNHYFPPLLGEDIAIWCLVSTVPDSDAQHDDESSHCQMNSTGWWRLALLVKDTVILGSALDARVAAVGTSVGHGIIGTVDGLVYMWELLTGNKLGSLHKFTGGSVSCIATDDSGSGVLAVADDRGQLLVYRRPQSVSVCKIN